MVDKSGRKRIASVLSSSRFSANQQLKRRCDHFGSADFLLAGKSVGAGEQIALDGDVDTIRGQGH
jgi:hypothetical protein